MGVAIRIVLLTAVAAFGCHHAPQESIAPRPDAKQDPISDAEDAREQPTPTRDRESEPVRGPARGQLGSEPFELVKSLAESIDGQRWRLRLMDYAGTCAGEQPPGSAEFVIVVERTTDAQRIVYDPFGQLNVLRRHFGGLIGSVGIEGEVELEALGRPGSQVHARVRITDKGEPLPSTLEGEVEIEICPGMHTSARPPMPRAVVLDVAQRVEDRLVQSELERESVDRQSEAKRARAHALVEASRGVLATSDGDPAQLTAVERWRQTHAAPDVGPSRAP